MILFILLLSLFLILNILDALTTFFVVSRCGYKTEKNPLVRMMIKRFGTKKGLIYTKLVIIPIIPLSIWCYLMHALSINLVLMILNIFYLAIVINNYRICRRVCKLKIEN